jgi:hypothetical protein
MLLHIEKELQALIRRATRILEILAMGPRVFPNYNHLALEEALILGAMWRLHIESLARGSEHVATDDTPFADFLAEFGKDAAVVVWGIERLGSAEGMQDALMSQIREAVAGALLLASLEEKTLVPLVRCWRSTKSVPCLTGVHAG